MRARLVTDRISRKCNRVAPAGLTAHFPLRDCRKSLDAPGKARGSYSLEPESVELLFFSALSPVAVSVLFAVELVL